MVLSFTFSSLIHLKLMWDIMVKWRQNLSFPPFSVLPENRCMSWRRDNNRKTLEGQLCAPAIKVQCLLGIFGFQRKYSVHIWVSCWFRGLTHKEWMLSSHVKWFKWIGTWNYHLDILSFMWYKASKLSWTVPVVSGLDYNTDIGLLLHTRTNKDYVMKPRDFLDLLSDSLNNRKS